MPIDVEGTIAGLDVLKGRIDGATRDIVDDSLEAMRIAGAANAPVGTPGNSTNYPGDLSRSIDVEGPAGADGVYAGRVGPTTVYGRQRELGGDIYPVLARFLRFEKFGDVVFTKHVYQEGAHYMLRSYEETLPSIPGFIEYHLVPVIEEA